MSCLSLENVGIRFGGLAALTDFSLAVHSGELVGLIGPNGAGKTTVFNIITGVYHPTSGRLMLDAHPLMGLSPHAVARLGIARTFQNIRLFPGLSAKKNVVAGAHWRRRGTFWSTLWALPRARQEVRRLEDETHALLNFVGLARVAESQAGSLPYGLQRRLEIARALMMHPKILLLDEPAAGMNPTEKEELRVLVASLAQRGIGIVVIEHDMRFVMGLCSRIAVLDHGVELMTGTPAEVQCHPGVVEAYLGTDP